MMKHHLLNFGMIISWVWPLPRMPVANKGLGRDSLLKNVIILVVTGILGRGHTQIISCVHGAMCIIGSAHTCRTNEGWHHEEVCLHRVLCPKPVLFGQGVEDISMKTGAEMGQEQQEKEQEQEQQQQAAAAAAAGGGGVVVVVVVVFVVVVVVVVVVCCLLFVVCCLLFVVCCLLFVVVVVVKPHLNHGTINQLTTWLKRNLANSKSMPHRKGRNCVLVQIHWSYYHMSMSPNFRECKNLVVHTQSASMFMCIDSQTHSVCWYYQAIHDIIYLGVSVPQNGWWK